MDQSTQPTPAQPTPPPTSGEPKSHLIAVILSVFVGMFGVDRFYLGNIGLGVAKLLLNWFTLGIWWLIDVILIATKGTHKLKNINWQEPF